MEADLSIRADRLDHQVTVGQLEKLTDEDLFAYMRIGHHDALAILFRRHHQMVFKIARSILRDSGEAEDLTQAVFFEIFQTVAQFDPSKGSSKSWLIRVAYHRSLNRKQYLKARAFYTQGELAQDDTGSEPARGLALGGSLKEQEAKRLVEQSLTILNEQQRKTLILAFFEGLSMAEIAERRSESIVNVRHHYYRGLKRLRSFLYGQSRVDPKTPEHEKEHDDGKP